MAVKPWREVAVPHEDVLKGTFQQAEFAADITRVHSRSATPEYQNPQLFFDRTYITEGMALLLNSVVNRLAGKGGDPVVQLQTAFGGGKTHSMLAVYHMACGNAPARDLNGIGTILDKAGVTELPRATPAVIDGINLSPNQPKVHDGVEVRTFLGELAWQLGGWPAFEKIAKSDEAGAAAPKEVIAEILNAASPCVILMDELVAYFRQFGSQRLTAGTFDTNITMIQSLTEAMKAAPRAILLASLPDSHNAGGDEGQRALRELENYFGRVQAIWKPVAEEEAFEIVRRRLFAGITDETARADACRAFGQLYRDNPDDFPQETQTEDYVRRMERAYPIHPEVFERFYRDWSSLPNFQRTRGVLKMMARVVHRLWQDNNRDLMVLPGSFPLYDTHAANELLAYLPQGWQPVLDKDIDGPGAASTEIDTKEPRFGAIEAARRCARTVTLGSAPTSANRHVQGIPLERVLLGSAQPGQAASTFKDASRRLQDKLSYLNVSDQRFWFDIRPNLRKEMEDRKHRYDDVEHVTPEIKTRLGGLFGSGVHVFVPSKDIPDDVAFRIVVLPVRASYSRTSPDTAVKAADEILRFNGDKPRLRQNRLVFLAADADTVPRLRDHVRATLAWQSIDADYKSSRLTLDNIQAKQVSEAMEQARETMKRTLRETFRWLLVPRQDVKGGKLIPTTEWDFLSVAAQAPALSAEVDKVLKENELLISEWSPIHLANLLKQWFWKDGQQEVGALDVWQKTCMYLYMPRLKDEEVFRRTLAAGAPSKDFFAFAYGKEADGYKGLSFGKATTPIMDASLLLVDPAAVPPEAPPVEPTPGTPPDVLPTPGPGPGPGPQPQPGPQPPHPAPPGGKAAKHYYGSVSLPPLTALADFMNIYEEVVQLFNQRHDTKVSITVDIRAETTGGFDDGLQRAVRENARVLKLTNSEFSDE